MAQDGNFRGQCRRAAPQGQIAPRLGRGARHAQRGEAGFAYLDHFLRGRNAFEAPAPVRLPEDAFAALAQFASGAAAE
jgi:hypothetical protein